MQFQEPPINNSLRFTCPSCGSEIVDRFCSHCGEKRLTTQDHSLWTYFTELLGLVTRLDSKLLRSVAFLVVRPGMLSVEYVEGRRVRYMTPLRLFVFVSIVYYVALTYLHSGALSTLDAIQFNTFTTPLAVQLHGNDFYGGYAATRVENALRGTGLDYGTFERRYDEQTIIFSKTLVFALIPVIAVLFAVFFVTKRRQFSAHLTVATHFWSFALLLIGVDAPPRLRRECLVFDFRRSLDRLVVLLHRLALSVSVVQRHVERRLTQRPSLSRPTLSTSGLGRPPDINVEPAQQHSGSNPAP